MSARRQRRRRSSRRAREEAAAASEGLLAGIGQFWLRFLRRRSTKWLAAAIITLTIGISLGVLSGGGGDGADDIAPTPTISADASPAGG